MASRPTSQRTVRAARELGAHLTAWRKLQSLTAETVADRAGISRPTLRAVEHGSPTVSMASFLEVARALGALDRVVDALDPYDTDLGRARADELLPRRVRP